MSHLCKAADNHLKKRGSGHLANGCTPATPCSGCSVTGTPLTMTLTASGITLSCPGTWVGTPNGTFTLTQTGGGSCTWLYTIPGVTFNGAAVAWAVTVSASSISVLCQSAGGGVFFSNSSIAKTLNRCDETVSGSNSFTVCAFGQNAINGSVTVTL